MPPSPVDPARPARPARPRRRARSRRAVAALALALLSPLAAPADPVALPHGVRRIADVAYGADPRQRLDVYEPAGADPAHPDAPVLFVVHGGGWRFGDKAMRQLVENKVAHWATRGWVVVSADYRLLPDAPVATQIEDVARALAAVQAQAARWGADGHRVVLMGHSAGAHLVSWLAAGGRPPAGIVLQPWQGAVLLDSAVHDVPVLMRFPHLPLYDAAFGRDPGAWAALSPAAQLDRPMPPMLLVCSARRRLACPMADAFARRAGATGTRASVLREDLSHEQINGELGLASDYTAQVDRFIESLGR